MAPAHAARCQATNTCPHRRPPGRSPPASPYDTPRPCCCRRLPAPPAQVALAAISVVICYADRSNISTAILPMSEQYGWAQSQQGVILSMFFLGYLCTQLLGGETHTASREYQI